ncbi:MAG: 2-oxoglutarate ferredoxin oxidoreductase subunit alpha, partial [Bacilli bacterium]|nr:2-oxoglutarate ferredoxin oxidoreductase subunit alpha [Bacilli bacterium]
GLAGMTETQAVIIDTQRGGPSTGLPTKHEQSDLLAALFGTHGEIPRIVLAPATAEECFYVMIDAFNLAEHYQCPVIVLTDLALSLAKQTVEPFDFDKIKINRGKLAAEEQLVHTQSGNSFKRYEYTEDSISPRVFPGQKGGVHHVDGVEHNEFGRPFEGSDNRIRMMDKRMTKLNQFDFSNAITYSGAEYPDLLIVGFGSTIGAIDETMARLALEGHKIGHAHIRVLAPFPTLQLQHYINLSNKVVVIENNATAQLNNLMKFFGVQGTFESQLKYNGEPYLSKEVYSCCKELL